MCDSSIAGSRRTRGRTVLASISVALGLAVLVLVPVGGAAQLTDAELLFYSALDEGYDVDVARAAVAEGFGAEVGAELASFWCAPPAGDGCDGSVVGATWQEWEQAIAGYTADELGLVIAENDLELGAAMAMYWCSPEPYEGCEDTAVAGAWVAFDQALASGSIRDAVIHVVNEFGPELGSALAAHVCGDLVCEVAEAPAAPAAAQPRVLQGGGPPPKYKNAPRHRRNGRGGS